MTPPRLTFRSRVLRDNRVVLDCWLETDLGDGWVTAYRLVPQNGRPVVGEVRIFHRPARRVFKAGEWAAETRGFKAEVPSGGLTSRMFKKVRPGEYLDVTPEMMSQMEAKWGVDKAHESGGLLNRHGFGRGAKGVRQRRGRPIEHDDLALARLARDYVRIIDGGNRRSPTLQLARQKGDDKSNRVSGLLNQARDRGMLTGPTSKGVAGGRLTRLAIGLLKEAGEETG